MREIKFRAWDMKDKKMFTGFSFKDIYSGQGEMNVNCYNRSEFHSWDDMEIMQFTGLVDNNGKEIYEGDIVRYGKMKTVYVVEWHAEFCGFKPFCDHNSDYLPSIVGNIYEKC